MKIYHVTELYKDNKKSYRVMKYDLKGIIHTYIKKGYSISSLLRFLCNSRLTFKKANELKDEKEVEDLFSEKFKYLGR